jgi:hypothetical protein
LFHRLLWVLAQFGQDELVRQIEYLKVENEILRSRLPKNIRTTPAEWARLREYGKRLGERHLQRLVDEYVAYYQKRRPHQGIGNVVLDPDATPPLAYNGERVESTDILGGLIKHYYRKAV